jgi:hypothetical protein
MRRADVFCQIKVAQSVRSAESACVASVDRHRSPRKVVEQPGTRFLQLMVFMSAFEANGNRIGRFRQMTRTPAFLQLRYSAVVFIDIVIASDCQYYF